MKSNPLAAMTGLGLGVGLMYLFDPQGGRRRRALVRDKLVHAGRVLGDGMQTTGRDVTHRLTGLRARARGLVRSDEAPPPVLEARVRSQLGRAVSHPHAIEVRADEGGRIRLSGPILAHEVADLLGAAWRVRGVRDVENGLEVHTEAGDVPGLQGGRARPGQLPELMQSNWAPATRLAATVAAAGLGAAALARGRLAGAMLCAGATGIAARGLANMPLKRLVGIGAGRRAVDLQKTIHIDAPVDTVYAFWSNYENFPKFMTHVREVRPTAEPGRSHWTVSGPAGTAIEWDADVTERIPSEVFAWKTVPGSAVQHAGLVRFDPEKRGTRVHIRMSYNPPAGATGHAVAVALGADPRRQMDGDLLRMKTLIETGKAPHDAARRTG
jgi:uncharacterized membrane protein